MNAIASNPSSEMMGSLEGQRVLLIGAEHGVGPAVADSLLSAGAQLVTDGGEIGETLASAGNEDLIAKSHERLGGLDVLVMSPPPVRSKPVLNMTGQELRTITEAELVIPALQMQAAARIMCKNGYGRIITLMSMSGKAGVHHLVAPYAAAKGGLLSFTRVLAAETAEHGVTVNAIATALFEPQTATMPQEKQDRLRGEVPVRRFGRSEEAAHAVLYLASPMAGFVTGECLNLSGGRFMD
ncbi:SDR family NAD(P)-dependent oxidoreductase [Pelagibacterium sp.]|uniref:SDR family NAD(P)-dependent oxidoreductase n=1 Tax=Pelagibacterium sp. TaxID=1967288 RepID=UPI003BAB7FE1